MSGIEGLRDDDVGETGSNGSSDLAHGAGGPGQGMWRAWFETEDHGVLEILDRLEDLGSAAGVHEAAADEEDRTTRWRVELWLEAEPDRDALRAELDRLAEAFNLTFGEVAFEWLEHREWLQHSSLSREPLIVGRFVLHGSGQTEPLPPGLPVLIDAGLAFGSGEHQTTTACLMALNGLLRGRRFERVLDMGCGSGVLGIAALKAGAKRALLVDNDPVAVQVAARNLGLNGVAARGRALTSEGYAASAVRRAGPYDLALANILADPLIAMAPDLARNLAPGGHAVLSGLLDRQAEAVTLAHQAAGLRLLRRVDVTPWTALVFKKR